jgi:hypothetical protein
MRSLRLMAVFVAFVASPAWAIGGGHGGGGGGNNNSYTTTTLKIVNDSDNAVVCSTGVSGAPFTLEPQGSTELSFLTLKGAKNTISITLTATIEGTTISDSETATIKSGNKATATITSPTNSSISIAFSGGGLAKVALSRDSSVMLASTGGLLPLLWLGCLLGRAPRWREDVGSDAEHSTDAM